MAANTVRFCRTQETVVLHQSRFLTISILQDQARIIHESATPTVDMNVLPCVLGCSLGEGTCPERTEGGQAQPARYCSSTPRIEAPCSPPQADYGECARWSIFKPLRLPGGTLIFFALAAVRSVPHRKRYLRQVGSRFHSLTTPMHELSCLVLFEEVSPLNKPGTDG